MNEREYELATLINSLQYDIAKLKEELESKYHEGYMDGKAFKDRLTIRDHFAGLAMQGLIAGGKGEKWWVEKDFAWNAYRQADAMLKERKK
jgi:hypothetical protein